MTYSILARDPETGELGVAVQSHWFSVGPIVPWGIPGVGVVATQANAEVSYGPRALELMQRGANSREALIERVERLYSVLGLLSLDAATHPTTFEQVEALQSCLPQARDALSRTTTLDSTTLATMFPFLSNSILMPDGILLEQRIIDRQDRAARIPENDLDALVLQGAQQDLGSSLGLGRHGMLLRTRSNTGGLRH